MDSNSMPMYAINNNNEHHHHHHHQQHSSTSINGSLGSGFVGIVPPTMTIPSQHLSNQTPTTGESFSYDNPRTLYVGNLDHSINEEFIHALFGSFGGITGLKLINDQQSDPYCFIEYVDHSSAASAISTMNKRLCLERELKVNWASSPGGVGSKPDTSKHHHIFVGDLSPEIETQQLRDAFSVFGEISDCRVVKDPHTSKSKCYGFVSFFKKQDAESAIAMMNGQFLGNRNIRTNWATRKQASYSTGSKPSDVPQIGPSTASIISHTGNSHNSRRLNFEDVYQQSSITNCTVYCGGIIHGLTDELIHKTFSRFGPIHEIRTFKDKGYAFIKFLSKEAATQAIVSMHNQEVLGQVAKCSWGKESIDSSTSLAAGLAAQAQLAQSLSPAAAVSLLYPTHQMYNFYQPFAAAGGLPTAAAAGQPFAAVQAAAAAAAAAGMQYHHNPYNQFYHHQANSATNQVNSSAAPSPFSSSLTGAPGTIPISPWQQSHPHHQPSAANVPPQVNSAANPLHLATYAMQGYQAQ